MEHDSSNSMGECASPKNISVQTDDLSNAVQLGTSHETQAFATERLVPYPLPNTVNLRVGSDIVTVNGDADELRMLQSGDLVRIFDARESSNWSVAEPLAADDGPLTIRLSTAYDHSRILALEKRALDDTINRLCYPHKKDLNNIPNHSTEMHGAYEDSVRHVASDANESIHSSLAINNARIWKLIPEDDDTRPTWRKIFDDGAVPWQYDHAGSAKCIVYFRVRVRLELIEQNCVDFLFRLKDCVHQQRVCFFENVPLSDVINEAFHAVCRWHPKGHLVDNVKWAKLSRKMKFLSNVKNTKHEIDMAFVRHNLDRKLDIVRFRAILEDIASIEHPALSREDSLSKVVWSSIVMLPDVNNMIWAEAKRMAMDVEARRVCAQTRISSLVRMHFRKAEYLKQKAAAVEIEKHVRSILARAFVSNLLRTMREIEEREHQFKCATVVQSMWRRFFWRNQFTMYQERLARERKERISAERAKLQELRQRERASIIFRRVICSDSIIEIATVSFPDECDPLGEKSMLINIYIPASKEVFFVNLKENAIREFLKKALSGEGRSSQDEMLKKSALNNIMERLVLREGGYPIFLLCKRNVVEKCTLVDKRVVSADGEFFILTIFRSPDEFIFSAYQCSAHQQLRIKLSMPKLREWLHVSKQNARRCGMPFDDAVDGTSILDETNQAELIEWLVKRVVISINPESGTMQMLLQFELEEERIAKLVTKVQAQWRRLLSLRIAKQKVKKMYVKIFVQEISAYAYRNIRTDERQWKKPKLLGNDDIDDPIDEWRIEETYDRSTGQKQLYYANYATGQTSWLSEADAARMIQRRYRSKHESDLLGKKLQLPDIVKATKFIHDSRAKYADEPQKLSNMVNYALVVHCVDLDFRQAKALYENALKQSPNHPLISRAYGILLLASRESPHATMFQQACRLFHAADVVDPTRARFQPAFDIYFRWAVISDVRNPLTLLNYALLHQCIYREFDHAEMIYRSALALDPTNVLVVENYLFFTDERYPGGAYVSLGPPYSVVRRSQVIEDRPEWAEWCKMFDAECPKRGMEIFWYNRFTKETRFVQPSQASIWEERIARSSCVSAKALSWVEYWDSRSKSSFFYNTYTKQYACSGEF